MALSDTSLRAAKPYEKPYKLYDKDGLYIIITPAGGKLWRFKYRYNESHKSLVLGKYPEVSLKEARTKRDNAKKLLEAGKDPSNEKKRQAIEKAIADGNTFKCVMDEFIDKRARDGMSIATVTKAKWFASLLENDLGKRPIAEIEPFEVLMTLKKIEKKGHHETAKRVCAFASRVFVYAVITGRALQNPAANLTGALVSHKTKHHAAIIEPKAVGGLLRAIEAFDGHVSTVLALKIAPHLFARPGELRHMEWKEIDFDAKIWRIPAAKMKMRREHVVPLSRQAIEILKTALQIKTSSQYVFPSYVSPQKPLSENTLNVALRRMGYSAEEMTSHGFRSTASTLLNESGLWSSDAIENALAHKDANKVRSAYHRGTHWEERVKMAQWRSDHLDTLRDGAKILAFKA